MLDEKVSRLMILYARRGIDDWAHADHRVKSQAAKVLGQRRIATSTWDADTAIKYVRLPGSTGDRRRFIPTPRYPNDPGFRRCFFSPAVSKDGDGKIALTLELFLMVDHKNCLAFRMETGAGTHDYTHLQLTRQPLSQTIESDAIPSWLPESYPAFGMPSANPLKMFLWMATAIHGNTGGFCKIVQELFQAAQRSGDAAIYLTELKQMFTLE